ncbi:hypothetical protein Poli38472_014027 [Pythium oligandrum]|uniref:Uncharacterized protein n=1 Tax=Pythium oligandrum TaxID=41045 RepID=A0A8K1CNR1_PYTOL|nr:hypothetical protein Poli38472_014027 [Pythium oligandrum]|eukprot:TMW66715.1 hypothetical protein Poli38472_014027 [Pythium oligandrum]
MTRWTMTTTLVLAAAAMAAVANADDCCSTCLANKVVLFDYDALDWDTCKEKTVCCFKCTAMGDPEYGDGVTFASDGTTPQVKAGSYLTFEWSGATKVTYLSLKEGQKKQATPTLNDTSAEMNEDTFMICAKAKGKIVMRAWGADTCMAVSLEKTIEVIAGDENGSCKAPTPTAPSGKKDGSGSKGGAGSGSAGVNSDIANCNPSRAAVKEVDGVMQCVCVSDWTGAPACDQMPVWKWLITIGGALAALFSILISVRAFLNSRKNKQKKLDEEAEASAAAQAAKADVETFHIGAPAATTTPVQTAYHQDYDYPPSKPANQNQTNNAYNNYPQAQPVGHQDYNYPPPAKPHGQEFSL